MRAFLDRLYATSAWAAAFFIFMIFLVVVLQVLFNLVDNISRLLTGSAIGLTVPSYSDFTGFFLAAASFLALAGALRSGSHIRVSLLIHALPERGQRVFDFIAVVIAGLITLYFTWYSAMQVISSFTFGDRSPGVIPVPIWIPQSAMTLGLVVLSIALIDDAICLLRGHRASFTDGGENLMGDDDLSEGKNFG